MGFDITSDVLVVTRWVDERVKVRSLADLGWGGHSLTLALGPLLGQISVQRLLLAIVFTQSSKVLGVVRISRKGVDHLGFIT